MRVLLAIATPGIAAPSALATIAVVCACLVLVSLTVGLCGSCFDSPRPPQPGPYHNQHAGHHQNHQQNPIHQNPYHQQRPPPSWDGQRVSQQYQAGPPLNNGHGQHPPRPVRYSSDQHPGQHRPGLHQGHYNQQYYGSQPQYPDPGQRNYPQQQYPHPAYPGHLLPPNPPSSQVHHPKAVPTPGQHIIPADNSLQALETALHQVCDVMGGQIQKGKTIVNRNSIRLGRSSVVADVKTNYAADETVMLFPDKKRKDQQMRLYAQLNLKDSMPLVSVDQDEVEFSENGRTVRLPPAIFVNHVRTLRNAVKGMATIEEKQTELFGIWSALAKVLKMFHARGWCLRDITVDNVVYVRMGTLEGWTLLEFGNAVRPSRDRPNLNKSLISARHAAPELAEELLNPERERVSLSTAYDMWMLGTLVWEVLSGEPYWKPEMTDRQILQVLADPRAQLAHEKKPVQSLVQNILVNLLKRDPTKRLSSAELIRQLEKDMATAGARTINAGPVVNQEDVVLAGT